MAATDRSLQCGHRNVRVTAWLPRCVSKWLLHRGRLKVQSFEACAAWKILAGEGLSLDSYRAGQRGY